MTKKNSSCQLEFLFMREDIYIFDLAKSGDKEVIARLIDTHKGLVFKVLKGFHFPITLNPDHFWQAGLVGLWKAVIAFDPYGGNKFSSFAYPTIRGYILREFERGEVGNKIKAANDLPISQIIDDEEKRQFWEQYRDPEQEKTTTTILDTLFEVARLSTRQRLVLSMRRLGYTLEEISKKVKVSRERIRQILTESFAELRRVALKEGFSF